MTTLVEETRNGRKAGLASFLIGLTFKTLLIIFLFKTVFSAMLLFYKFGAFV